ncbi:MAG: hypothetical protein NZO58_14775, partial [Gemmataceae bacterium]|nr:hypothetical protein [Gemmataceae bacterium]
MPKLEISGFHQPPQAIPVDHADDPKAVLAQPLNRDEKPTTAPRQTSVVDDDLSTPRPPRHRRADHIVRWSGNRGADRSYDPWVVVGLAGGALLLIALLATTLIAVNIRRQPAVWVPGPIQPPPWPNNGPIRFEDKKLE